MRRIGLLGNIHQNVLKLTLILFYN